MTQADPGGNEYERLQQAARYVKTLIAEPPQVALVLGSGLNDLADAIAIQTTVETKHIPHLVSGNVDSHRGDLVFGNVGDVSVCIFRGRVHLYEGYRAQEVVRPIRLARLLGADTLVLTNAAGGIRSDLQPGDLMALEDHLNLSGQNPLSGPNEPDFGPRFPDMSHVYDVDLLRDLHAVAQQNAIELKQGVYAAVLGPCYETPAEVRMLRTLGADTAGMSTVLETIAARHAGMRIAGISCITNKAAGLSENALSHDEVVATGARAKDQMQTLILGLIERLAQSPL